MSEEKPERPPDDRFREKARELEVIPSAHRMVDEDLKRIPSKGWAA